MGEDTVAKDEIFAIIETGSKQYNVSENTVISVEKLDGNSDDTLKLDKVLLINDGKKTTLGTPYIDNAHIEATILDQEKEKKKIVFKFKRKTGYKKKQGHRQQLTTLKVTKIVTKAPKGDK